MVAAAKRTIFAATDIDEARDQLRLVADGIAARYPAVSELLLAAEEDVIAHMAFPCEHWSKIASTNSLERVNKEIKRRTRVVRIFPNEESCLRLVSAMCAATSEEWMTNRRFLDMDAFREMFDAEREEGVRLAAAS